MLSRVLIAAAIRDLAAEYAAQGISPWDINNGHCEDFAGTILDRLVGPDWVTLEGAPGTTWWTIDASQLLKPPPGADTTEDADSWDWDLLRETYGIDADRLPPGQRAARDAIACPWLAHIWIFSDGLHFDCDRPDGVADFFEFPFFQRKLKEPAAPQPLPS